MTDVFFPFVGPSMLSALELLGTPVAIITPEDGRPVWANSSALAHWNAESLERLHLRLDGEPCSAIADVFDQLPPALMPGEQKTIALRGDTQRAAGAAAVTCTGVSLDRHPKAVMVEFHLQESTNRSERERLQEPLISSNPASAGLTETPLVRGAIFASDAPERLITTEAAMMTVLRLCPMPALVMTPGMATFSQANPAAIRLLSMVASDAGAGIAWFANQNDARSFFEKVERFGSFSATMSLVAKSGRTFLGALSGKRLEVGGRALILVMIQDVDSVQRASAELETALGIERALRRKQRRMLEIASHEFRTPLAVIDGAAQRIVRGADSAAPAQIRELAERVREFVGRMGSLLDNTIDRVRNNVAEIEFRPQPDSLQRSIAQVATVFEDNADIELAKELEDLPEVWFDRVLIEQALVNLVENAIKYSTGRASIFISAKAGEHHIELLVRDMGIGIVPDEREHVFAEGARGKNVGRRSGTGLGLYIVDAIIRAHGGKISVEDTDGPGTTLKIVLPLRQQAARLAEKSSAER